MINDKDSDLAAAWFSNDTNVQIGRLLGITPRQVRSEFERLARAGIIPHAIREHVKMICREEPPIMGRQITALSAGVDRLLARLTEVHGGKN